MNKLAFALSALGIALLSSGCVAHFSHSVSASNSYQGTPIDTEVTGTGILMLSSPDLDADQALKEKCPSGKLSNVETEGTMRNWLGIVQAYKLRVKGICNP